MLDNSDNKSAGMKSKLRNATIRFLGYVFGFGSLVIVGVFILIPLFEQATLWLKTGRIPDRDLYWATAENKCAATNFQARGWEGMELCRPDYIQFTDWIGIDRILNYLFDQHIAIITILGLTAFWFLVIFIDERLLE